MLKEKFSWREQKEVKATRYHECVPKNVPLKYFGEITDDDYRCYVSNTKRVGLA